MIRMAIDNNVRRLIDVGKSLSSSGRQYWQNFTYTEFVAWLGVTLTPAQEVIALVAFDGVQPRDLPDELKPIALKVLGSLDDIPPEALAVICAVCGGRGGKTYTLGSLRLLHLTFTVDLSTMAPGEQAVAMVVASDKKTSIQALNYVIGAIKSKPELHGLLVAETTEHVIVRRPDMSEQVRVERFAAGRGGFTTRGRSLVGVLLDEIAFFRDSNYQVNDEEVFKSVRPRVLPGGQTILASTPFIQSGLLYTEFKDNHPEPSCAIPECKTHGRPHRALALHAPTELMRNRSPAVMPVIEAEYKRDPSNAEREYGAKFMSAGASLYFDAAAVQRAQVLGQMPVARSAEYGTVLTIGADLAFIRDCAAACVVEKTRTKVRVLQIDELKPGAVALKPSEVWEWLTKLCRRWGADEVVADQHYSEAAREALDNAGVTLVGIPAGQTGKAEIFKRTRDTLHEGDLELPLDDETAQQLKEVTARPTPGGGVSIEQPRKPQGGHGDRVSALVAAVWRVFREVPAEPPPVFETPLHADAAAWERRLEERRQDEERAARRWESPGSEGYDPRDDDWIRGA